MDKQKQVCLTPDEIKDEAKYFHITVKGDSMAPKYIEGDTLICRNQNDCESGQCCVLLVGDDLTFRKVVKRADGGITLTPINPACEAITYSKSEIRDKPINILGVVERTIRDEEGFKEGKKK